MKNTIVEVPCVERPIADAPGFQKKELADYKLDLLGLCGFGCRYCSSNSGNYLRMRKDTFADLTEEQIGVRTLPAEDPSLTFEWPDILEKLEQQLEGRPDDWGSGKVLMFSMLTDGFSPNLVKSGVTEKALRFVLEKTGFRIRVLTKNAIVGTDHWVKFFQEHRDRFVVGLSIGTTDNSWATKIEVGTSIPKARLRALRRLQDAGVPTFGMLCPVFPDMLEDGRFEELIDAHRPEMCEHMWCEPFNDRANWRIVRDGFDEGTPGHTWLTEVYENRKKDRWSACARDLYVRMKQKAAAEGWCDKVRYLLYEDHVTEDDAPAFAGLEGILLQCKPDKHGKSPNKHIAALQAIPTAKSNPKPGDGSTGPAPDLIERMTRVAEWARRRGVPKERLLASIVALAADQNLGFDADQISELLDSAFAPAPEGPSPVHGRERPTVDELIDVAGVSRLTAKSPMADVESSLELLATLSDGLERLTVETLRQGAIRDLKRTGVASPKGLVDAAFAGVDHTATSRVDDGGLPEETPWPDAVDGETLLNEIVEVLERYLALPPGAAEAMAAWALHTYVIDATAVSPFLALNSPEKRCGKTSALTLLDALVKKPLTASNITPAALFRSVEKWSPTLLIDEADTFIRKSDDLRGILNSGHTRSAAYVIRVVGDDHTPKRFSTWCPKAIAMIGRLPATLEDRAIVIPMRRRASNEQVERLRQDRVRGDLEPLRRKAVRWANDHLDSLIDLDPEMPTELHDRAQDNCRPLFAIAAVAEGNWPLRIAQTARVLAVGEEDETPRIQLLADLRELFKSTGHDRLTSKELVRKLTEREDRPWAEWTRGQPITASQLARLLKNFKIKPKTMRVGTSTLRGYKRRQFDDVFERYLPADSQAPSVGGKNYSASDDGNTGLAEEALGKDVGEIELLNQLDPVEYKNAS